MTTHDEIWRELASLRSGFTEEEYMRIFGRRTIGIAVERETKAIVFATPEADRLFGYVKGQLATLSLNDLIPEPRRSAHDSHWERVWAAPKARMMGTAETLDIVGLHREGHEIPIEVSFDFEVIGGKQLAIALISPKRPAGRHIPQTRSNGHALRPVLVSAVVLLSATVGVCVYQRPNADTPTWRTQIAQARQFIADKRDAIHDLRERIQ